MERDGIIFPHGRRRHEEQKSSTKQKAAPIANATIDMVIVGTDFRGAISHHMRASIFLIIGMIVISFIVGYSFGWGLEVITYNHPNLNLIGPEDGYLDIIYMTSYSIWGLIGSGIFYGYFVLMMIFTLFKGDDVLMYFSGARLADTKKDAVLHNVVEEVSIAAGKRKPRVYVIETEALNAFATGIRDSHASVAATRGLIDKLNREELQGVMAHEMGHIVNSDIKYSVAMAAMVGLVAAFSAMMREMIFRFGVRMFAVSSGSRNSKSSPLPLLIPVIIVWLIVGILAPIAAVLLKLAVSRQREYLADATAIKITRNPRALASALLKISDNPHVEAAKGATDHLFIEAPKEPLMFESLFSTHPPIKERVRRLQRLGSRL